MGDETEFCQRIELDKQKLLDNELQKIEVDTFSLTEFWVQFGFETRTVYTVIMEDIGHGHDFVLQDIESSVQSLSNEVTKIGFMCGKKPFPKREEVDGMMSELSQRYGEMRDLFLVLPEEVGSVVYKSAKDAVANIMSSLLAVVKSLKDLTEVGAKERLTLTGTFWDACNAVDKLPRNNLQACIAAVDAEQSLVNDAVEELKQVKDSVPAENLDSNTKPKIAANDKTDDSIQSQSESLKCNSGTEDSINVNVAKKKNKKEKVKKGLVHVYSKAKYFNSKFKNKARRNMLNKLARKRKSMIKRSSALKSSTATKINVEPEDSDAEDDDSDSDELFRHPARISRGGDNQTPAHSKVREDVLGNDVPKTINKPIRYRTIAESDYVNLGHWVRVMRGWNMPLDASNVSGKFNEIVDSLQMVADKWTKFVDLGIFENLTADQIKEKEYLLLTKLDDFKAMKGILDHDPRAPDALFTNPAVRDEPSTSSHYNDSEENVVSSTSDYVIPAHFPEEVSFDPESDNFVTSSDSPLH